MEEMLRQLKIAQLAINLSHSLEQIEQEKLKFEAMLNLFNKCIKEGQKC